MQNKRRIQASVFRDETINDIKALEDRRYRAVTDGDPAVLDELCWDDLIYTHSKGDHADRSYNIDTPHVPRCLLSRFPAAKRSSLPMADASSFSQAGDDPGPGVSAEREKKATRAQRCALAALRLDVQGQLLVTKRIKTAGESKNSTLPPVGWTPADRAALPGSLGGGFGWLCYQFTFADDTLVRI